MGYLSEKKPWVIYIELISVQLAPLISGARIQPKCVKNIGPQAIAVSGIILLVRHNLRMLFGKLSYQFPSSIVATVIKHIDVITPM